MAPHASRDAAITLSASPRPSLPRRLLLALLDGYRRVLSPLLGPRCRFSPTCSRYASTAIGHHGVVAGSYLAVARVLRCHPLCEGGYDPVPERFRFAPWRDRPPFPNLDNPNPDKEGPDP